MNTKTDDGPPGAGPTRLTALDAAFLAFESARTPVHVGSVCFFDGAPFHDRDGRFRLDALRARVGSRLHLVPRLRQIPVTGPLELTHPLLVDDPAFDIAHHVKLLELGAPGDEAAVFELAAELHMEVLDRRRPLWELWFVDGLEDGRVALIEKIHHAIADGVSGVEVATVLLDLERDPAPSVAPAWTPRPTPRVAERLGFELVETARRPLDALGPAIDHLLHPVTTATDVARDLRAVTTGLAQPLVAPRCSLNQPVGHRRRLGVVRRPLADVRAAARRHGAKINDVVLSSVAGGLRVLLEHRGELGADDPAFSLRALVPVSMHGDDGSLGNQVAGLLVPLPVGQPDAMERVRTIAADMADRKRRGEARSSDVLLRGADLLPAAVTRTLSLAVHHQPLVNVVVTNVPGPQFPLYALGAEMLDAVPIVPLGGNLAVSIGVLSYNGGLDIGLFADPDLVADLDVLIDGINAAFDDL